MVDFTKRRSAKRQCIRDISIGTKLTEDRISSLSDEILLQILEKLPLQTVIKTSSLSRRWFRLWTLVPVLSFKNTCSLFSDSSRFALAVDNILSKYCPLPIRKFCVDLRLSGYHGSKLSNWLRFAIDHSVKELLLDFHSEAFTLPSHLCFNSCVSKLWLRCSKFVIPSSLNWTSLRCLTLKGMFLGDTMIEEILSGCPVIEELELSNCVSVTRLDFSGFKSLKKLLIRDFEANSEMTICAPNLRCLSIDGSNLYKKYCFENLKSLVEAELKFFCIISRYGQELVKQNPVRSIMGSLCHVEKLTLQSPCPEVLSFLGEKSLPSLSKLKNLVLYTHFAEPDVIGLACILKHSPNLESLSLKLSYVTGIKCGGKYCYDKFWDKEMVDNYRMSLDDGDFKCLSLHLKTIRILKLGKYQCEDRILLQVVEFLLKNALVLEELSIISSKPLAGLKWNECQFMDTTRALLNFPRASPAVKILLS